MPILDKYNLTTIKAEVLCAELMQNGLLLDRITYKPKGSFRQSYRPDIESIPEHFDDKDGFTIEVNRDGIYDRLPEGLFHQTRGNGKTMQVAEMVAEHKRYRDEEESARKFFLPFEQEIFRYGVMAESEERKQSMGFYDENLQEVFFKFWNINDELPKEAAKVLVRILPWATKIKGDITLTGMALAMMIGHEVKAEILHKKNHWKTTHSSVLGQCALGIDTVAGHALADYEYYWQFTIRNLSSNQVFEYTDNQPYALFLKRFVDFFIPVEIDATFDFETDNTEQIETELVLGYCLTI